jgi:hypothetical protein
MTILIFLLFFGGHHKHPASLHRCLKPLPRVDGIRALKANGLRCVSISTAQAGDVMGAQQKAGRHER